MMNIDKLFENLEANIRAIQEEELTDTGSTYKIPSYLNIAVGKCQCKTPGCHEPSYTGDYCYWCLKTDHLKLTERTEWYVDESKDKE